METLPPTHQGKELKYRCVNWETENQKRVISEKPREEASAYSMVSIILEFTVKFTCQ